MTKIEDDLQAVQDDLKDFIEQQKMKLDREKTEIDRKRHSSPRLKPRQDDGDFEDHREYKERKQGRNRLKDDDNHRGLNLGQYEQKQNRLRDERTREYKSYLAEQELRKTRNEQITRRKDVDRDDRDTLFIKKNHKPRTPDKYDDYDEILRKKRAEEKKYRERYDDPEINTERRVHFEESRKQDRYDKRDISSNDDELFEWARGKAKLGRRQSATEERKEKNKLPYDNFERSVSLVDGAIFGGKDDSRNLQKKKEEYKRDLEQQIKEKEKQKHKEKLKRMGRITSSDTILTKQETPRDGMSSERQPQHNDTKEHSPHVNKKKPASRSQFPDDDRSHFRGDDRPHSRYDDEDRHHRPMGDDRYRPPKMQPYYPNMMAYDPYMAMMYGRYNFPNNIQMGQFGMPGPGYGGMGGYRGMESNANVPSTMRYNDSRRNEREQSNLQLNLNGSDDESSSPRDSRRQRTPKGPRKKDSDSNRKDNNEYLPSGQTSDHLFNGHVAKQDHQQNSNLFIGYPAKENPDSNQDSKRAAQVAYQQELQRQIREKQQAKEKEKSAKKKLEAKLEAEIAVYDPWGKGGAGAPVKDVQGNVVADLRTMRQFNEEGKIISPREKPTMLANEGSPLIAALDASFNLGQLSARNNEDVGIARGVALKELQGLGIKELDIQKNAKVEYADYLKQQVETKKREELEKKEKIRIEEEKESQRLIEQQEKIYREFIEEKESQRRKEEEARQQNDVLRKVAEQKKIEIERERKEIDEERQRELKRRSEERSVEQKKMVSGGTSPPIPTIRKAQGGYLAKSCSPPVVKHHVDYEQTLNGRGTLRRDYQQITEPLYTSRATSTVLDDETQTYLEDTEDLDMQYLNSIRQVISKPLPEETKAPGMLSSSDAQQKLFNELTALRYQLQQQERRIQTDLEENKAKYKELKSKGIMKRNHLMNMEIFDKAMQKKSSVPHKKVQRAAEEFKQITDNTSVLDLKVQDHPTTSSTLDIQQRDFIRQQEQKLSALRKAIDATSKNFMIDVSNQWLTTDQRRASKKSLLDSDSKFISIDDPTEEVEIILEHSPRSGRKSSTRERRISHEQNKEENLFKPSTPGVSTNSYALGSTISIEQIAAKNEERLRKLDVQSKNIPGTETDNQEELNEFVDNKQSSTKGRPKSKENTSPETDVDS